MCKLLTSEENLCSKNVFTKNSISDSMWYPLVYCPNYIVKKYLEETFSLIIELLRECFCMNPWQNNSCDGVKRRFDAVLIASGASRICPSDHEFKICKIFYPRTIKFEGELALCLVKHNTMKTFEKVKDFLQAFLSSALDWNELSLSRLGCFTPGKELSFTVWQEVRWTPDLVTTPRKTEKLLKITVFGNMLFGRSLWTFRSWHAVSILRGIPKCSTLHVLRCENLRSRI
jgi:hypothetical protein